MLRPTTPEDAPALLALTAGTGMFKEFEVDTLGGVLEDFHREGDDSGHVCLTFDADGTPAGFVYFAPEPMTDRTWELWWIVVDKARQGKGDGRWLLEEVEKHIRQLDGRLLLIETSSTPHYEPTRRFYLRNGYDLAATIPDFYADGDGKCVYWKKL